MSRPHPAPPALAPELADRIVDRLGSVRRGEGRCEPGPAGASGARVGRVVSERPAAGCVVLRERGVLSLENGPKLPYTDALRFERLDARTIGVSHLRNGDDRPVPLVRVEDHGDGVLASGSPHRCGDDRYALRVRELAGAVELRWTIRGPRKDGTLTVAYSTAGGES